MHATNINEARIRYWYFMFLQLTNVKISNKDFNWKKKNIYIFVSVKIWQKALKSARRVSCVIKTCSSFGNLKMDANEGIQSFNVEAGQKFKSFKRIDGWKCLKTKLVKQRKQPNGTVQSVTFMLIFMHP